jgi:hypothetical protein
MAIVAADVHLRAGQLWARPSSVLEPRRKGRAAARTRSVRAGDYSFKPGVLLALHGISHGGNRSSVRLLTTGPGQNCGVGDTSAKRHL